MTIQTKHFIELADIIALRFTCKHCDATLSLLMSDDKLARGENRPAMFLDRCPSCSQDWAEVKGSTCELAIRHFTAALDRLKNALNGEASAPFGFSLMLEVKTDAVPGSEQKRTVAS